MLRPWVVYVVCVIYSKRGSPSAFFPAWVGVSTLPVTLYYAQIVDGGEVMDVLDDVNDGCLWKPVEDMTERFSGFSRLHQFVRTYHRLWF